MKLQDFEQKQLEPFLHEFKYHPTQIVTFETDKLPGEIRTGEIVKRYGENAFSLNLYFYIIIDRDNNETYKVITHNVIGLAREEKLDIL